MAVDSETKRIPLDRRVCIIRPERIDIRPSTGAVILPAIGLLVSIVSFVVVALFANELPLGLLAFLLVPGVIVCPLSAMGLIYSLAGAYVIVDSKKQSASFQQGVLGLGLGITELVPFWKVDHIAVDEVSLGEAEVRRLPPPIDLRSFNVVLTKTSGKRLSLGEALAPNTYDLVVEAFDRALDTAEAVAKLIGVSVRINVELEEGHQSPEEMKQTTA